MAEAEDGKNGQQGQEGQGGEPEPIDYKAKYEAMKSHSREWERKAKENQGAADELEKLFDYQSECHCSKTHLMGLII